MGQHEKRASTSCIFRATWTHKVFDGSNRPVDYFRLFYSDHVLKLRDSQIWMLQRNEFVVIKVYGQTSLLTRSKLTLECLIIMDTMKFDRDELYWSQSESHWLLGSKKWSYGMYAWLQSSLLSQIVKSSNLPDYLPVHTWTLTHIWNIFQSY